MKWRPYSEVVAEAVARLCFDSCLRLLPVPWVEAVVVVVKWRGQRRGRSSRHPRSHFHQRRARPATTKKKVIKTSFKECARQLTMV